MTLKCIAGIEKPDEGKIILNDRVLFDSEKNINLPPQERKVGLLFQSYALFPNMTLKENIEIAIRDKKNKSNEVDTLISNFSLNGLEDHYPHQLSGGQQQRVALARMIINEPEILMLDEPFSALDEHLRWQMEKELIDVIKKYKVPTIYVSHNKNEVYRISDSIAVMEKGKVVETNTKENIFNHPQSINTAILIGYKNISEIEKIDDTTVYAKDWNITLSVDSLKDINKYVGINENHIHISHQTDDINRLGFYIIDKIDNIDHDIFILDGSKKHNKSLYMSVDKEVSNNYKIEDSIYISLPQENINLFN